MAILIIRGTIPGITIPSTMTLGTMAVIGDIVLGVGMAAGTDIMAGTPPGTMAMAGVDITVGIIPITTIITTRTADVGMVSTAVVPAAAAIMPKVAARQEADMAHQREAVRHSVPVATAHHLVPRHIPVAARAPHLAEYQEVLPVRL